MQTLLEKQVAEILESKSVLLCKVSSDEVTKWRCVGNRCWKFRECYPKDQSV